MANGSSTRRRILFLDYTNGIGLGGGQRSLQLLLEELDRDRFEIALACPGGERILDSLPSDIRVYPLDLPERFRALSRRGGSWTAALSSMPGVCRLRARWAAILRQARPSLIHANNMKMLFASAIAAHRPAVPRLWHVRDILPRNAMTHVLKQAGSRLSARVLAVSQAVARQLPSCARTEVLYNAVRLPPAAELASLRREFRRCNGIDEQACVIGYAGRLDTGKGLDVLLEAFCMMSAQNPRLELLFAGHGPVREALERVAGIRGLRERIRMAGFQEDMSGAWSAMDIAAVPSTEPDSFPRSAVEAMAYGLPVVGSDTGGIGEAIATGETGFLTPPGDAAALARVLGLLVRDEGLRRVHGEAGRLRCERLFGARAQAVRLASIYEDVLEPGRRAGERERPAGEPRAASGRLPEAHPNRESGGRGAMESHAASHSR